MVSTMFNPGLKLCTSRPREFQGKIGKRKIPERATKSLVLNKQDEELFGKSTRVYFYSKIEKPYGAAS